MRVRWSAVAGWMACAALAVPTWHALRIGESWSAECSLSSPALGRVAVTYPTQAFDEAQFRRLRQDGAYRTRFNRSQQLVDGWTFTCERRLRVGDLTLEPDTYRALLAMNDAGAFQLEFVVDGSKHVVSLDLEEDDRVLSSLVVSLMPGRRDAMQLRFAWGPEYGSVSIRPVE